jgi:carbonic anhydrase/acetyltransferase-like protein (isoleucine patch superfamily)
VGFRAVVFDAVLGDNTYVGAGAVVQSVKLRSCTYVVPGSVIVSQKDADDLPRVGAEDRRFMKAVAVANTALAKGYRAQSVSRRM